MGKHEQQEWAVQVDREYAEKYGSLAHFVQTLDGLGMEDFPERDYFIEAGKLLDEAAEWLRGAVAAFSIIGRTNNARACKDLASRIEAYLKGRE